MSGSAIKYWGMLATLLALVYGSFVAWRTENRRADAARVAERAATRPAKNAVELSKPFEDFSLTDQDGEKFDSASLRGKVWVGSFFFTNCPGDCLRLNQALAALQQTNPASEAKVVSITCDPENDTPEAMRTYAERFRANHARWTFLTGDMKVIRKIGDMFHLAVAPATHSNRAFVVDRQGLYRGSFILTEPDQLEKLSRLVAAVEAEATTGAADPGGPDSG